MEFVFRIQRKSRITRRDSGKDTGHSLVQDLTVERFKDASHPVFKSISALSRGILKKKNGRDTIHFNADAYNTKLLFRIIHSVKSAQYLRCSFDLV